MAIQWLYLWINTFASVFLQLYFHIAKHMENGSTLKQCKEQQINCEKYLLQYASRVSFLIMTRKATYIKDKEFKNFNMFSPTSFTVYSSQFIDI